MANSCVMPWQAELGKEGTDLALRRRRGGAGGGGTFGRRQGREAGAAGRGMAGAALLPLMRAAFSLMPIFVTLLMPHVLLSLLCPSLFAYSMRWKTPIKTGNKT